jgi:hypothetical protein
MACNLVCIRHGQGGEMTQALYAHVNNKTIKKRDMFLTMVFKALHDLTIC